MAEAFLYSNKKEKTGSKVTIEVNPATNSIDNIGLVASASKGNLTYESDIKTNGQTVFRNLENGDWTFQVRKGNTRLSHELPLNDTYEIRIGLFSFTFNITYPEGSTCTVYKEDGSLTFTAPNTSGYWSCTIPEIGSLSGEYWIVKATDGTNTTTKSFSVIETNDGQSIDVKLSYQTYLYKDGNQYASLTGGWEISSLNDGASGSVVGDAAVFNDNSVLIQTSVFGGSVVCGGINTINLIDLSNIKTLKFTISDISTSSYLEHVYLGVYSEKPDKFYDDKFVVKVDAAPLGEWGTYSVDVSNINSGYVAIKVISTNYQKHLGCTITEIEAVKV